MNALPQSAGFVPPETAAKVPAIRLERLGKTFDPAVGPILDDISLTVGQGDIYGIIGRSGAGKSTLVRCINRLERPTAGRVLVAERDITALAGAELRSARRDIGMIFQHFNLLSSRTVAGNVALPLEVAGLSRAEIARRIPPLLELVGLADKAASYPSELSGGQKQRVGIARALATNPSVLLCDEATSALDPETTEQILSLLKDINRRLGLTIVLITHEMQVVRDIASHVAVLERGRLIEEGVTFDVLAFPKSAVARSFLSGLVAHELPPPVERRAAHRTRSGYGSGIAHRFLRRLRPPAGNRQSHPPLSGGAEHPVRSHRLCRRSSVGRPDSGARQRRGAPVGHRRPSRLARPFRGDHRPCFSVSLVRRWPAFFSIR